MGLGLGMALGRGGAGNGGAGQGLGGASVWDSHGIAQVTSVTGSKILGTLKATEDKAVDLYVLEMALISMHSSSGNVIERVLTAYRKSSKQWCSTLNKLAQAELFYEDEKLGSNDLLGDEDQMEEKVLQVNFAGRFVYKDTLLAKLPVTILSNLLPSGVAAASLGGSRLISQPLLQLLLGIGLMPRDALLGLGWSCLLAQAFPTAAVGLNHLPTAVCGLSRDPSFMRVAGSIWARRCNCKGDQEGHSHLIGLGPSLYLLQKLLVANDVEGSNQQELSGRYPPNAAQAGCNYTPAYWLLLTFVVAKEVEGSSLQELLGRCPLYAAHVDCNYTDAFWQLPPYVVTMTSLGLLEEQQPSRVANGGCGEACVVIEKVYKVRSGT
ncbi:EKC/KEOPS complex subunit TP53RK [Bienertia sinuspersici]